MRDEQGWERHSSSFKSVEQAQSHIDGWMTSSYGDRMPETIIRRDDERGGLFYVWSRPVGQRVRVLTVSLRVLATLEDLEGFDAVLADALDGSLGKVELQAIEMGETFTEDDPR